MALRFRQHKKSLIVIAFLSLLLFVFFFVTGPNLSQAKPNGEQAFRKNKRPLFSRSRILDRITRRSFFQHNLILFYTEFYSTRPWRRVFTRKNLKCRNKIPCELTYDRDRFVDSHVIIFHAPDMPTMDELRMLSNHSVRLRQVWIYFTMENSLNTNLNTKFLNFFNKTMSYRQKSGFVFSYGYYFPKNPAAYSKGQKSPIVNYAENKTEQIAWLVSNCGRMRDTLVTKLAKVLKIHVGGKCRYKYKDKIECSGDGDGGKNPFCSETLRKFKFYLAFENNFCPDYITEKYWLHPLTHNMIPIVLGGANYKDPRFAIPGSYINVFDFRTPKHLIEYIQKVDTNDTLYNSYFSWKQKFTFYSESFECHEAINNICSTLYDSKHSSSSYTTTVSDVAGGDGRRTGDTNLTVGFDDSKACYAREWLFKMWLNK